MHYNKMMSHSAWGLALAPDPVHHQLLLEHQATGEKVGDNPWQATTLEWAALAAAARQLRDTAPWPTADLTSTACRARRATSLPQTNPRRPEHHGDPLHRRAARPDTGLNNGKLGIWLFLASEVMLFGALFAPTSCCASGAGAPS